MPIRKINKTSGLYTPAEVAQILSVSLATIYRYMPRRTLISWSLDFGRLRPLPRSSAFDPMRISSAEVQRFATEVLLAKPLRAIARIEAAQQKIDLTSEGGS